MIHLKKMDKRQSGRIEQIIPVNVYAVEFEFLITQSRDNPIEGCILNVSEEGALLRTGSVLNKNQLYMLEIQQNEFMHSEAFTNLCGFSILFDVVRVVSFDEGQMVSGIQFKPLDEYTRGELNQLVDGHLSRILKRSSRP